MEPQPGNRVLLITLLAVVLTALITGGAVYAMQNKQNTDTKNDLQSQVDGLRSQLTSVQKSVATPTPSVSPSAAATASPVAKATATPNTTAEWKTYTNTAHKYSVKYPSAWAYREFPDLTTGAGFRLSTKASDPVNEFITVDYVDKATQNASLPLDQYLRKEGAGIENYGDIVTMDTVTTSTGVIGYKVTWKVTSRDGKTTSPSNPITYYPTADGKTAGMIVLSSAVSSDGATHLEDYSKMILTFAFVK